MEHWWEQNGPKLIAVAFAIIVSLIATIYVLLRSDVSEVKGIARSIEQSVTAARFSQISAEATVRVLERDLEEQKRHTQSQWDAIKRIEHELSELRRFSARTR